MNQYKYQIGLVVEYITKNIFKEKELNPKYFPIELKHEDYEGVIYESDGKNYNGYVILDE